jgi:hypothetical protein
MRHRWSPKLAVALFEGETRCIYCGAVLTFVKHSFETGEVQLPSGERVHYGHG